MVLSPIREKKLWLRKQSMIKAVCMSAEHVREASAVIASRVLESPEYENAGSIFTYVSTDREPDTYGIIEEALDSGKAVYVPKCLRGRRMIAVRISGFADLGPGVKGLMEPKKELWEGLPGAQATDVSGEGCEDVPAGEEPVAGIDLAIVPCVCASKDGRRLGHGAGYYDAFFSKYGMIKMCLCFEELISDAVPMEEQDVVMDFVVTEEGIAACGRPQ